MKKFLIGVVLVGGLVSLALLIGDGAVESEVERVGVAPTGPPSAEGPNQGFLHGRVTTHAGASYEGRLRFGGDEEALWGNYFNGTKDQNPWVSQVPPDQLTKKSRVLSIFGITLFEREQQADFSRPFMARFGEIQRIEASGGDVRVTLKSGTVFDLDRLSASDFDDGLRVWDTRHGVVDLDSLPIRSVDLFPSERPLEGPWPLWGTVSTALAKFTGFVQWNRQDCLGSDELEGETAVGALGVRFDTIGVITRASTDGCVVTRLDGSEVELSETRESGRGHRGIYVDDPRYGRVLVSWSAFERFELGFGESGPGYEDFPPGVPLTGEVVTRRGVRLKGRLVFDLDESETTETLDAPSRGVDYTLPFGLIATLAVSEETSGDGARVRVALHSGEELMLERSGDLGPGNAGLLVFPTGEELSHYVPWTDVGLIELDQPPTMYPPAG